MCRNREVLWSPERARMQGRSKCVRKQSQPEWGQTRAGLKSLCAPLACFGDGRGGLARGWRDRAKPGACVDAQHVLVVCRPACSVQAP